MDLHKKFIFAINLFLILLLGGTFIYSSIEGWRYIDSVYFTVATVTTVGYGDIVPQTDIGKIFTMFFSFFGVGMAFYFFTLFGKYIYKKTFQDELKEHHDKLIKHFKIKCF
ncbi:MAG: potassium channel family protein [archaeon]